MKASRASSRPNPVAGGWNHVKQSNIPRCPVAARKSGHASRRRASVGCLFHGYICQWLFLPAAGTAGG